MALDFEDGYEIAELLGLVGAPQERWQNPIQPLGVFNSIQFLQMGLDFFQALEQNREGEVPCLGFPTHLNEMEHIWYGLDSACIFELKQMGEACVDIDLFAVQVESRLVDFTKPCENLILLDAIGFAQ